MADIRPAYEHNLENAVEHPYGHEILRTGPRELGVLGRVGLGLFCLYWGFRFLTGGIVFAEEAKTPGNRLQQYTSGQLLAGGSSEVPAGSSGDGGDDDPPELKLVGLIDGEGVAEASVPDKLKEPDQYLDELLNNLNPEKAERYNKRGRYNEVIDMLEEPIKKFSDYDLTKLSYRERKKISFGYNEFALAHAEKSKRERNVQKKEALLNIAEKSCREGIEIFPDSIEPRLNLAGVYCLRGDYETALELTLEAKKIEPKNKYVRMAEDYIRERL